MKPLSFLPDSVAAALTAPVVVILFSFYLSAGTGCIRTVDQPEVLIGAEFIGKPVTTVVQVDRDSTVLVQGSFVPASRLREVLVAMRARSPEMPLELQADRKASMATINSIVLAARESGYQEFYVFGKLQSPLTFVDI